MITIHFIDAQDLSIPPLEIDLTLLPDLPTLLEEHTGLPNPVPFVTAIDGLPSAYARGSQIDPFLYELAELYTEDDYEILMAYSECVGHHYTSPDLETLFNNAVESHQGQFDNMIQFAQERLADDVPDELFKYIDWEQYSKDRADNYFISDNGHVFDMTI